MHEHFFLTDKKGIFLTNEIKLASSEIKGTDVLVISENPNESIFDSIVGFAEKVSVLKLFILDLNNPIKYELKRVRSSFGWDEYNSYPGLIL